MKKLKQAGFVLLAVLFAAVFCGCAGDRDNVPRSAQGGDMETLKMEDYQRELGSFEGLDAETEWQILLDYYNIYEKSGSDYSGSNINDYYIYKFYGTYNAYVMVGIAVLWPTAAVMQPRSPYIVADIKFTAPPEVWKNRRFYDLRELYEAGLLSYGDIESIARRFYPEDRDESFWRIK